MVVLREARHEDIPQLIKFGRDFVEFTGYSTPYCAQTAEQTFRDFIDTDGAVMFVIGDGEELYGMLAAMITPCYWNAAYKQATEVFWWVDPAHRGGYFGEALLDAYESWAKEFGAFDASLCGLRRNESITSVFSKRGFKEAEVTFTKEFI